MAKKSTLRSTKNMSNPRDEGRKRKLSPSPSPKPETKSRFFKSEMKKDEDESISDGDASSNEFENESEEDNDDDSSEDPSSEDEQPRRKRKTTATTKATKSASATGKAGNELWRQGVKTGLAPGTQVVIKKPKPRSAGSTPYTDITVHPNTMLFIGDLKANNDREWLKMHDPDFRTSLKDWNTFVEALSEKLIGLDDTIPELPIKDIVFRIYRDIRFSKNPTPYKPYFSAAWSRTGRKGPYAAYYIQISPDDSFVGGGLWSPEAQGLASLRRAIDENPQQLKDVLMDDRMRREFLSNTPKKADKVVKAFVGLRSNAEHALRTKPKKQGNKNDSVTRSPRWRIREYDDCLGYDAGHPDIELLRLKSFTVGRKLTDSEVLDAQVLRRITELFSAMQPFIACLNHIVMPDPSEDDEGDEEDQDEQDEGSSVTEATDD